MLNRNFGTVSVQEMITYIEKYVDRYPDDVFHIAVGTDSQNFDITKMVVAVVVYREGKGGTFFYDVKKISKIENLRQKIYYETEQSLRLAAEIAKRFADDNIDQDVEIHCDIGKTESSKTRVLVNEIVGWVTGSGFTPVIKPNSYAASCVADKISK